MKKLIIIVIRGYQRFLSPLLGQKCRFHPTCSTYAIEVLQRYGMFRGAYLAVWRLLRCGPWCNGGDDPVPLKQK